MTTARRHKGRSAPRKRPSRPKLATINQAHAREISEIDKRGEKRRLYPEPEPKGRYRP